MLVKMLIAIDIDPEEYPIPADGKVSEEIYNNFEVGDIYCSQN